MAVEPVGIRIADDAREALAAQDVPATIGLTVGCRQSVTGIFTPAFAPEGGSPFRDATCEHAPLTELPKQLLDGPLEKISRRIGRFQPTTYGQAQDDQINDVARKAKEHPP